MAASATAAVPQPPRKTLLDWIEADHGAPLDIALPACSATALALHARIVSGIAQHADAVPEPLAPPPGFALVPLG